MSKVITFIKNNESIITMVAKLLWPIVLMALLFFLDGRYVKKEDYSKGNEEVKSTIQGHTTNTSKSLDKLTDSINALAELQRQNAENQKVIYVHMEEIAKRFDRHEVSNEKQFDLITNRINRVEDLVRGK